MSTLEVTVAIEPVPDDPRARRLLVGICILVELVVIGGAIALLLDGDRNGLFLLLLAPLPLLVLGFGRGRGTGGDRGHGL